MMTRLAMILAAAAMVLSTAHAGIGDWKNFTAMNSVRAIASSHDSVWAATSGGVFLYRLADSSFVRITNSEGLTTNDVTAIAIDHAGSVWFGQLDGSIDVYTPSTGKWRYVRDIASASKPQKKIMSFALAGDSLYIATSFGVSLFSVSRFEFIDTYANFGTLMVPPVVSVAYLNKRVYAATSKGVAVSKTNAVNLAAPESWEIYTSTGAVSSLSAFQGAVTAAGAEGLFTFNGSTWIKAPTVARAVSIVAQTDALLYLTGDSTVFSYAPGSALVPVGTQLPSLVTGGAIVNGTLALATVSRGIAVRAQSAPSGWTLFEPNGPSSNSFVSLAVDDNGVIWAASGRSNGSGFYSYDGRTWTNYVMPTADLNNSYAVAIGPNNSKWVSTWGGGLILVNSAGVIQRLFDHISPGFIGTDENNNYIVPAKIGSDDAGNVWTSIYNSADRSKVVWKMNADSTWVSFGAAQGDYRQMLGVLIDRNNTKWFSNAFPGFDPFDSRRIVYLNEKLNVSGTSDGWGMLSEANGATSSLITAVIEDRDGVVWLGTSVGITVINDPLRPSSLTKVFLGAVRDQYINCLVVDAVNNKWIGTARGVFVVSPDGTSLLDQYTVANSNGKLVDDNVLSIAFDEKNGLAYFGTAKGLSSVGIQTVAPAADYSQIAVYPNPFRPVKPEDRITIEGLAEGSTIKILTITGKLVKQFSAQGGGRAFWDGTTESGEPAASGIYLAVAYSENGNRVGSAKLAVIRR